MRGFFFALPAVGLLLALAPVGAAEGKPVHGKPAEIPGIIQAEDFDRGGEGVAYHDQSKPGDDPSPRKEDAVGIEPCQDGGGGFNIGWTHAGEWLNYTVNVRTAGDYRVEVRVAADMTTGGQFHLEFDGKPVTGLLHIPATGGWQNWQTIGTVSTLKAGVQVMRLCLDMDGSGGGNVGNFNWLKFSPATPGEKGTSMGVFTAQPAFAAPDAAPPAAEDTQERKLADALAESGATLLRQGNIEKGKDYLYKALAHSENSAVALYELGRRFEEEKQLVTAGEFLVRAGRIMAQEEKANPALTPKRLDAERRVKALNPFAGRFTTIMEDYAQELEKITKRVPDSVTREVALERVDNLGLASLLAPDKLPKIEGVTKPPPAGAAKGDRTTRSFSRAEDSGNGPTVVPPEVEVALKKAGWTKITGTWAKKAEGVFEVTDGRLEAQKSNGAIEVTVHKGFTGRIKILVRNAYEEDSDNYVYSGTGFGMVLKGSGCKVYVPTAFSSMNSGYEPYLEREDPIPDANPKNRFMVTVQDTKLQYFMNDKVMKNANYKIGKDGPFIIDVRGTATLENPRNMGE